MSLTARLAEFFRARPGQWINGLDLAFAGSYAWRSRVSDLRRAPYFLNIQNRQRRVGMKGHSMTISEYRFMPGELRTTAGSAAAGADTPAAAV